MTQVMQLLRACSMHCLLLSALQLQSSRPGGGDSRKTVKDWQVTQGLHSLQDRLHGQPAVLGSDCISRACSAPRTSAGILHQPVGQTTLSTDSPEIQCCL